MFTEFQEAVTKQLKLMEKHQLYRTGVSKDELWDTYLGSFPEGSNPIFRERTEHDCSCCKQFIKAVGNVVAIGSNGKLMTVWDGDCAAYDTVTKAMERLVRSRPIVNVFAHTEPKAGNEFNYEATDTGEDVTRWDHFFYNLQSKYVMKGEDMGTYLSQHKATHDVFERGLMEISTEAIDTVLELIEQGSLYRGEDHKFAVSKFKEAKRLYNKAKDKVLWPWFFMFTPTQAVLRIRNTSVGTLLINLSEDMPLDTAVGKFEALMAPSNYKRPTALITKGMIEKAKKDVDDLGFTTALDRRYAEIEDITVNNVLWADRSVKPHMAEASPFDDLSVMQEAINKKSLDKVEEVRIEDFIHNILPEVTSIEVLMENRIKGNLFSLIAPQDPDAEHMFKWHNNFSWSYNGEMADSMKERVKSAGGDVTGDLRFSIQWNDEDVHNNSDYDAHCLTPQRRRIYFSSMSDSTSGGRLDVDRTSTKAGVPAVENITFPKRSRLPVGEYQFLVHNYSSRQGDTGFRAEIEFDGVIHSFNCPRKLKNDEKVAVASVHWDGKEFKLVEKLSSSASTQEIWGLTTQQFVKVETVMFSPNYWDDHCQGNKHHFFVLEGCANPEDARGFYNEFLHQSLDKHRKVFEVLGSKLRATHVNRQLSGVGFSSTVRNHVFCKVVGNFTRTIKVLF